MTQHAKYGYTIRYASILSVRDYSHDVVSSKLRQPVTCICLRGTVSQLRSTTISISKQCFCDHRQRLQKQTIILEHVRHSDYQCIS